MKVGWIFERPMRRFGVCILLLFSTAFSCAAQSEELRGSIAPERPFVEVRLHTQVVNFDIMLHNMSLTVYRLVAIQLKVFDIHGALQVSRQINENGKPAAIELMGKLTLLPGETVDYFQPFTEFNENVQLGRLHIELLFVREGGHVAPIPNQSDQRVAFDVFPRPYRPAAYLLPLPGTMLVQDGHDLYSHHRRHTLAPAFAANSPLALPNMYAYDLVKITDDGSLVSGDPSDKFNWLSYGVPVTAPAAGVVVRAVNDIAENGFDRAGDAEIPPSAAIADPNGLGNCVVIRHSDGRHSWLLHLQPGTVKQKIGDRVKAGQYVGRVGFSGDSLFPHLHFTVTDGAEYPSNGMPSYFKRFLRVAGSRRIKTRYGQIDTGDIVAAIPGSVKISSVKNIKNP